MRGDGEVGTRGGGPCYVAPVGCKSFGRGGDGPGIPELAHALKTPASPETKGCWCGDQRVRGCGCGGGGEFHEEH